MNQKIKKKFNKNRHKQGKKTLGHQPIRVNGAPDKKEVTSETAKIAEAKKESVIYADYKPRKPLVYKYIVFDHFAAAHQALESIMQAAAQCDRLNVVIKAEGDMEDSKILGVSNKIQIYAGEAWYLIHTRRVEENWYDHPRS